MILDSLARHASRARVRRACSSTIRSDRLASPISATHRECRRFSPSSSIPFVRRGWHVTTDPHRVIVTGSSAGGLGAAYVAFARPDLFGNVWSQSGAFWRGADASNDAPYEWLTQQVKTAPKKDVRFYLDVGELEDHPTLGGSGPNFRDANRRFRDGARGQRVPGHVH